MAQNNVATNKTQVDAQKNSTRGQIQVGHCVIRIGQKVLNHKTHAIVLSDKPTPQERYAAGELQLYLEKVAGVKLSIVGDSQASPYLCHLIIGKSNLLKKMSIAIDWDSLGLEGIVIKTVGDDLVLAGNKRGVMYAVYTFLEDYVGISWLAPDCTVYPKKAVEISSIDLTYIPPFEYRESFSFLGYDADYNLRNKSNGLYTHLEEERGGCMVYEGQFCHTFKAIVPADEYFNSHPEYFALVKGKRDPHGQLCLSNPEVTKVVIDNVLTRLKANPGATTVSVSQNDGSGASYGNGNCQCEKCLAIDKEEGSPSGAILRLVNQVAKAVEKEFPDRNIAVDTLAYTYSLKPPRFTRPRHNVIVRLCLGLSPPFDGPQNEKNKQALLEWNRICNRIYVWFYPNNFGHYLQPYPDFRVLKPEIKFYADHGGRGLFANIAYDSPGTEFQELRTWLILKLMWNPQQDEHVLIDRFLEGYYGKAAPKIREYIDLMCDAVEKTHTELNCWNSYSDPFLNRENLTCSEKLFDQAERAVVDDPVYAKRVRIARLPLMYVRIMQGVPKENDPQKDRIIAAKLALIDQFAKEAKAAGITRIREGSEPNFDKWLTEIRNKYSLLAKLNKKTLKNATLELTVFPGIGGRIWRMVYLPTKTDILKVYLADTDFLRYEDGGYEEYSERVARSPGCREPFKVLTSTDRTIVQEATLPNGLVLHRSIKLDKEKPIVEIVSTLTNPTSKSIKANLRIHPVFDLTANENTTVWGKTTDGGWNQLHSLADTTGYDKWFRAENLPDGEWALVDKGNELAVVNRFQKQQVDSCYTYWEVKEKMSTMELFSSERELKTGGKIEMNLSYEIIPPDNIWFTKGGVAKK
jgi:hypothetical protein